MPKETRSPSLWERLYDRLFPLRKLSADLHQRIGEAEGRLETRLNEVQNALDARLRDIHTLGVEAQISTTPVLMHELNIAPIYLKNTQEHPIFNPSATRFRDQIIFISRCSNFLGRDDRIGTYASLPHHTVNVIHRYDASLNLIDMDIVDDELLRRTCPAAECGIEDLRLFVWKDALWAVAAGIRHLSERTLAVSQLLVRFESNRIVDFILCDSPTDARFEKNWIPIVRDEELFVIYRFRPMVIYEYEDGALKLIKGDPLDQQEFSARGGTQFVRWGKNFIGLVHSPPNFHESKIYYTHRFVVINDAFEILEFSRPFFIQRRGIEFACGLTEYGGDLLLSYGVSDRAAAFCILPSSKLSRWVVP